MKSLSVILLLLALAPSSAQRKCLSKVARSEEHPHGANELIEYSVGRLKRVRGQITYPDDSPVEHAVIEVYRYGPSQHSVRAHEVATSRKRLAAYIADAKGRFCLAPLPPGHYFLRVGTRASQGMQEVSINFTIDPRQPDRRSRETRPLKIRLPLGT